MPTLMVAVAVATGCCAVARIVLYRLHPGMDGLGQWAVASIIGALSFAVAGSGGGIPDEATLSLTHLLIVFGFGLVWDGFRRFLGRGTLPLGIYILLGVMAVVMIAISRLGGSMALRATFNSLLICLISSGIARELLWEAPASRLAMRLAGWIYGANALFFLVRALSIAFDVGMLGGRMSYGVTAIAALWWLCVTVSVTLCMVLMTGERLQEDLNRQANRDPLTGALNRRAFAALADKELARARRGGTPLSLLMIDMDHFKQINDCLGHGGGDEALTLFAALAERELRVEDLFCRFGGEEFLALLPGSSAREAERVAERLRIAFTGETRHLDRAGTLPFAITLSAGIAALEPGEELEELIRRADMALYRAKDMGRDRCEMAG